MISNEEVLKSNSISIEALFKNSARIFLDNIILCVANTLLAFLATVLLLFTVIGSLALPAVWGGYSESMIRLSLGQKVEIGDFFRAGFNHWSSLLLGFIVYLIGVAVGLVLFIIPGIYLIVRWYFWMQIVVHENLDAMEALKKSGEMTSSILWEVVTVFIACAIIGGIGGIVPFLPLVTTPFAAIVAAKYYTSNLQSIQ